LATVGCVESAEFCRSMNDNTPGVGYRYRPIMYVHNIREEGVTLHALVTQRTVDTQATGCAKTNRFTDGLYVDATAS